MTSTDKTATWPGWETVRLIGRGSFGAVYEIERDNYGHMEKAALKVISIPQSASDIDDLVSDGYDEESITSRFEGYMQDIVREYSMMADMKGCANIVYCDDWKSIQHDDGMGWDIFIKMELLTALPRALGKTITDEQVIRIGMDICNALAFCESLNLLHRDIKPQNIFVAPDGTYKLGDFGIAKTAERTTSGTKTGTYKYMAPEVYNNQPYGGKADIYSLGLVLYWLLNERRTPFLPLPPATPTSTEEDKARAKRFSGEPIPAPAHGSKELQRIVLKACAFNQRDRYQNAEEMLRDLGRLSKYPGKNVSADDTEASSPLDWRSETVGVFHGGEKSFRSELSTKPDFFTEKEAQDDKTIGAFAREEKCSTLNTSEKPTDSTYSYNSYWGNEIGDSAVNKDTSPRREKNSAYSGRQNKAMGVFIGILAVAAICAIIMAATRGQKKPSETIVVTQYVTTTPTSSTTASNASTPTAIQTPEPTQNPYNASTPTAMQTPEPTQNPYLVLADKVCVYDSSIEIPIESEMLSNPITLYVEGSFPDSPSGGMYLCRSPGADRIEIVKPHTPVTAYAVRGNLSNKTGHAFVETGTGHFGWIAFQSQRGTGIGLSETNDF